MKLSRKIQYVAGLALITFGCGYSLQHKSAGYLALCVNASNIVMMRRTNLRAPVPGRQFMWMVAILLLVLILILLSVLYFPKQFDTFACQPAFLVPFWALLLSIHFWAWRKEARELVAAHTESHQLCCFP